jgi:hypothetical protein
MQTSLRGMVATCKDHRIGEMSVIAIATSTGELPPYPTPARRRRRRCHCGGGRRAAGGGRAVRRAGGPGGGRRQLCKTRHLLRACVPGTVALVHAPYDVAVCCERRSGHINDNNPDLLRMPNWVGGAAVGRSYYSILPYPSVRMFLGGGVPAGLVGGRHTQPGSTRTPSPACGSGKQS